MKTVYCMGCMRPLDDKQNICPRCGYRRDEKPSLAFALPPGSTLGQGRYVLGKVLGQGGFGLTYIGLDQLLKLRVAVKEFFPSGMASRGDDHASVSWLSNTGNWKNGRESFLKEARNLARINQIPCVVAVKDLFYQNNTAYIVMDYVEGETLRSRVMRTGVMSWDECVRVLRPIAAALGKAHERGLIHRDVSPDNIMISKEGSLWLLDLGAAKALDASQSGPNVSQSTHLVVKRGFSPPEQYVKGSNIGAWTDVYALCATVYFCLTGQQAPDAVRRLAGEELSFPKEISPQAARVLRAGMAMKIEERIADMDELTRCLDTLSLPERLAGSDPAQERKRAGGLFKKKSKRKPTGSSRSAGAGRAASDDREKRRKYISLAVALAAALLGLALILTAALAGLSRRGPAQPRPEPAQLLAQAEQADAQGRAEDALALLLRAAEAGDPEAMVQAGLRLEQGRGAPRDYAQAALWYEKAAEAGRAEAMNALGDFFYYGLGVEQDYAAAAQWYVRAAGGGSPEAMNSLGYCYELGLGVERDYAAAAQWYARAAEQGNPTAMNNLANCYEKGLGVEPDPEKAAEWRARAESLVLP